MKKTLVIVTICLISSTLFSQVEFSGIDVDLMRVINRDKIVNKIINENAQGSPYFDDKFNHATVSGIKQSLMVRYNAEQDIIEYQSPTNDIFPLNKTEEFGDVIMNLGVNHLRLFNYINSKKENVNGFLFIISNTDDVLLLRRDRIVLMPEKQPKTSYDTYSPPKYVKKDTEYYIKLKSENIIQMPKNKKAIITLYENHKDKIELFFKTNDLSFKQEKDLILITKFISTL